MAIMNCFQVQPNEEMTVDEFKAWLRQFDGDHDGRISQDELKEALQSLRIWFRWWKAHQVIKEANPDCTVHVDNAKEIAKLVSYAQKHLHMKIYGNNW